MTRRWAWLIALCLYAAAGVAEMALHLVEQHRRPEGLGPADTIVAFAGGLFWPVDLVARALLAR